MGRWTFDDAAITQYSEWREWPYLYSSCFGSPLQLRLYSRFTVKQTVTEPRGDAFESYLQDVKHSSRGFHLHLVAASARPWAAGEPGREYEKAIVESPSRRAERAYVQNKRHRRKQEARERREF